MKSFNKTEINYIFISTLILGFCFSFRWRGSFSLGNWASAFISSVIIIFSALFLKIGFQKYIAKRFECEVTYDLWRSGLVLAILTTFGSLGYLIWAAPGAIKITNNKKFRPGRVREEVHSGPYEHALIAISGIIIFFAFAVIGKIIFNSSENIFGEKLIFIGSYLALFNLIPFVYPHNNVPSIISKGNLPTLDGVLIFFGSRPLWAFSFSFVLISVLGFLFLGAGPALVLAIIGSVILFLMWHYYIEPWNYASPTSDRFYRKNDGFSDTLSKKPHHMGKFNNK